ncbi:MAG: hypothetical protein SGI97_08565 [candidate division Zixibacteria bacterium]|nr:hypothetical protein [candidate division Zixibacteria bacterium]
MSQFYSLETNNLRLVYYGQAQAYLASHVARCYENSLQFHRELFNYRNTEKTTIFLQDFSDYGNAGAGTLPWNHISLSIAPYNYVFETSPANERMNSTMNHEVVHLVASDKAARSDRFFRSVFRGKVTESAEDPGTILYAYLTSPRRSAPRWFHEGIAVFLETWMAGGLGRALGAWDEMVFRTKVCDSSRFYDLVGLESEAVAVDFQSGVNSYLYGTRFMTWLSLTRGPEKLIQWIERSDSSRAYYASQFKQVYRISLDSAWSEWTHFEHEFQNKNLDRVRQYPITATRDLTPYALGSVSRPAFDTSSGKIYFACNRPGENAKIVGIDTRSGLSKNVCNVKDPALFYVTSLCIDAKRKKLFYTTDNNAWRDICSVDLVTGKTKTLLKDERIGDLAFNQADSSLWGVRHFNGISTLTRIPYPYDRWIQVYSWPYGMDIYDIDVSPDGVQLSAALSEINGRQSLIAINLASLLEGDTTYTTLHNFENSIPQNFTYSSDGTCLYGSSYYTGASNIFRYDLKTKHMAVLSNSETGFFRPIPLANDSLLVFRFTSKGFIPAVIKEAEITDVNAIHYLGQQAVETHPILTNWLAGSLSSINLDSITTHKGDFSLPKSIRLASIYPVVEGYQHYTAAGMRLNFSGPIGLPQANLTVSYTPAKEIADNERWHLKSDFMYINWSASATYNAADFYDLFGPTKSSRKGYSAGIHYKKTLIDDSPKSMKYSVDVTGYGNLDRLPSYQNIATTFTRFLSVTGSLSYQNLQSTIGAVDNEYGHSWQVTSSNRIASRHVFSSVSAGTDIGLALPIKHSSIWLRTSAGYSPGIHAEPLSNFYFGGFGNNWVDYQTEKRYRMSYSFPGTELNAIGGTNYTKATVEWTLPPIRFRRLGNSSFYATWIRAAVFSSGIITNVNSPEWRRKVISVGGQADLRMTLLSHVKSTFSFGYALAFEEGYDSSDEIMLCLKLF